MQDHKIEIKYALRTILNEVAKAMGYDNPIMEVKRDQRTSYYVTTVTTKRTNLDEAVLKGIGMSVSRSCSQYDAICDALLMVERKFHVFIKDINYGYYSTMFSRVKDMENKLNLISEMCNEISGKIQQIGVLVDVNESNNGMLINNHSEVYSQWFRMVKAALEKNPESVKANTTAVMENAHIASIRF